MHCQILKERDEITGQNDSATEMFGMVDAEIEALNEPIDNSRTLTDIQAVIVRLKCWIAANPQYQEQAYPVFAQLYRREEGMKEAATEAERMRLSVTEQEQRERLSQLRYHVRAEDSPDVFYSALDATVRRWQTGDHFTLTIQ